MISYVDLLAFGPHPDDIEIGMGATVAHHVAQGLTVGLCDLTRGEMGTNGTPEERVQEGDAAGAVLGASWRVNLGLPDRHLRDDPGQVTPIVELIRAARPSVVALPHWVDRHPDHTAASTLVTTAAFSSGLRRFEADGEPWRPDWLVYYFINTTSEPSFVIDVSDFYEQKRQALACHRTQFTADEGAAKTRLTSPLFAQLVESRDAQFGSLAGVRWAEGFVVREPIVRRQLLKPRRRPTEPLTSSSASSATPPPAAAGFWRRSWRSIWPSAGTRCTC
jgi:bacillithiol biosynthesis deacetylase BshB1